MKTAYSERHKLRDAHTELYGGQPVSPNECPVRAEDIIERVRAQVLGPIIAPEAHGLDPVPAIHDARYGDFLRTCWRDWVAEGFVGEAIATARPSRRMTRSVQPRNIDGRIGYYYLPTLFVMECGYAVEAISVNTVNVLEGFEGS